MLSFFFILFVSTAAKQQTPLLTVTPWCANSIRVTLSPTAVTHPVASAELEELHELLAAHNESDLPAALIDSCGPGATVTPTVGIPVTNGNLKLTLNEDGLLSFSSVDSQSLYFSAAISLESGAFPPYLAASVLTLPGNSSERFFGLGQTGWTAMDDNGCPVGDQRVVPLQRNGQTVSLQQTKFHVSIPFVYSTAGYGFLYNMPGYGLAKMGNFTVGGMEWRSEAALQLDFWVTGLPFGAAQTAYPAAPIYRQYADATGHAPILREEALNFWQSRNRYKSSDIALSVASRYATAGTPVGMYVIDFYNQVADGDFRPNPDCFPSLSNLSTILRTTQGAGVMFSLWPEVLNTSSQYTLFLAAGCLRNADLGGWVLDTTIPSCRDLLWQRLLLPHYFAQGVDAFWLDESDGEGTAGGDGTYGYDTSFGPAPAFSQLWVGSWISTFSTPVARAGQRPPLVLTRGVWAGGQRYGVVLWSSDIESTFETLAAQIPLGVHASLSGIPWWTSDVGGFGCNIRPPPNDSEYMKELIVRWYQFGMFCVSAFCVMYKKDWRRELFLINTTTHPHPIRVLTRAVPFAHYAARVSNARVPLRAFRGRCSALYPCRRELRGE